MRRLGYIRAFDGVRAVAIVAVIGFHTKLFPGGEFGVDVFFVLSGFLITTLLLNEHASNGRISLRGFYRRRALRLLPALFTMIAAYLATAATLYATGRWDEERVDAAVRAATLGTFYAANFAAAYSDHLMGNLNHLWSLATEEQFYAVLPLLLVAHGRIAARAKWLLMVFVGALALVLAHRTALALSGGYSAALHAFYGPDCRADGLILGCIAGVAFSYRLTPRWVSRAAAVAAPALCLLLVFAGVLPFMLRIVFLLPLLNLAAAVVILNLAERPHADPGLERGLLVYVGRISYGLYLWHPLTIAVFGPVGAVASVPIAAASYRFVEQPLRRRRHVAWRPSGAITAPELP